MKLEASPQNVFSFNPGSPFAGQWTDSRPRQKRQAVRAFGDGSIQEMITRHDELARKQEIICAFVLVLCLLFTVGICCFQLANF